MDVFEHMLAAHRYLSEQKALNEKIIRMMRGRESFWEDTVLTRDFFRFEIVKHIQFEECVFFPVLRTVLKPAEAERLDSLVTEHAEMNRSVADFARVSAQYEKKRTKELADTLADTAINLLDMLVSHAQKEDDLIQPVIKQRFSPSHFREMERLYFAYIEKQ